MRMQVALVRRGGIHDSPDTNLVQVFHFACQFDSTLQPKRRGNTLTPQLISVTIDVQWTAPVTDAFSPLVQPQVGIVEIDLKPGLASNRCHKIFRRGSGILCLRQRRLRLSEFFSQDDSLGNLSHRFASLSAFCLHGSIRFIFAQR